MATPMLSVCHAVYDNGDHCVLIRGWNGDNLIYQTAMTADEARGIATSLTTLANHCDEANTEAERVAACLLEKFTRQKD